MRDLTKAIYARLIGDTELLALLGQFEGYPTIFVDQRVPADAPTPYIHSSGNVSQDHFDTKTEKIAEAFRDITVIVGRGEENALQSINRRVHDLFHRHALSIDDAMTVIAQMSGPLAAPSDEYVAGSVHTLRLRYEET